MGKLMAQLYDDLNKAKAFELSFTNFVYLYDDVSFLNFESCLCQTCGITRQVNDYLVPKANCKKPCGILSSLEFGVNQELRDELIEYFDITEKDFRPVRNKRGEIVYYQITPQHTMLPIYKENGWKANPPCPDCGSVRYEDYQFENDKGEFFNYISREALDEMRDLNVTYEKRSRFYRPRVIISRRVYDFLVDRYPRTHYFPLYLKN